MSFCSEERSKASREGGEACGKSSESDRERPCSRQEAEGKEGKERCGKAVCEHYAARAEERCVLSTTIIIQQPLTHSDEDMSQPMSSGYDPIAVESAWYEWWDAQGFFAPQTEPDGSVKPEGQFVIPAPPPNVTGSLHIGHALTVAIQDALVRWNRMLGKTTLFVPGFDHAGISTQSVVEKRLYKSSGKTRHDLGREKLLDTVWEWKNE